jgi:hypothetical protein
VAILRSFDLSLTEELRGRMAAGRGLHSFTVQLDLSASSGIGGACRGRLGVVQGMLGDVYGVFCVGNGSS